MKRRDFLRLGAMGAVGALAAAPRPARVDEALRIRIDAARRRRRSDVAKNAANGDEARYPSHIASFTKGLPHDAIGVVDAGAFAALVRAMQSGREEDFEAIPRGGLMKLVNPRASFSFSLEGCDPQCTHCATPPAFASAEQAAEAVELYWQALTRDVPFDRYGDHPLIARAAAELHTTPATLFRGDAAGDRVGPYLSQFLWKEIPYGAIRVEQRVRTATAGIDYLTDFDDWLAVQNGAAPAAKHAGQYRYMRSNRDLAAYLQLDFSYQAFETACLVLFGMQGTIEAQRPYKGAPWDKANPYRASKNQTGFVTFGVTHALDLVARAANEALKATWYHKWIVHRRLRPEEFGGRVQLTRIGKARDPLHDSLLSSDALEETYARHGSWLLPQAYPEGAPLHPSYPAGHAAIAGACTTMLKAVFDESFPIEEPVVSSADGLRLMPYSGPRLTVGGELDKLASNIAIGRNAAGVHWRSDAAAGLRLGEAVALALLEDARACYPERFTGFSLTTFDGVTVAV